MQTVHCCVFCEVQTSFGTFLLVEVNECLWELEPLGWHGDVANLGMTDILFFIFNYVKVCVCLCVCAHDVQVLTEASVSDPLERELHSLLRATWRGCWEWNSGPLEKQEVLPLTISPPRR